MKYIGILETKKCDSIIRVQTTVRDQRKMGKPIPQQGVQAMMNLEKMRAYDELANEHNIEEVQIQKAQDEHQFNEDKDFTDLMEKNQQELKAKMDKLNM